MGKEVEMEGKRLEEGRNERGMGVGENWRGGGEGNRFE